MSKRGSNNNDGRDVPSEGQRSQLKVADWGFG